MKYPNIVALAILLICQNAFSSPTIKKYDLHYAFDFKEEKLFCTAYLTLDNLKQTDTLHLLLYRLLKIKSVKDSAGDDIRFLQSVESFSDWEVMQVNAVSIFVNKKDYGSKLRIEYEGYLLGYTETGMKYIKDNIKSDFALLRMDCFAYPVQGITSWKANRAAGLSYFDYTISVTVPDSLTVINGGSLISQNTKSGLATYVYQNLRPAWRIDIAIGKYNTKKYNNFNVHYFIEDSVGAFQVAKYLRDASVLYTKWFGDVHIKSFSIIEIPDHWGSQTDVTCILQDASAFRNENNLFELYHEISHIWNVTATDKYPCRLESEGLAVFLQYLMMEKLNGRNGLLDSSAQKIFERLKKKFSNDSLAFSTPIKEYGTKGITDYSYSKGMLFFYVLYKSVGEEVFIATIRGFYDLYRASGASTEEFSNYVISKLPTERINRLVNDWVLTSLSSNSIIANNSVHDIIQ